MKDQTSATPVLSPKDLEEDLREYYITPEYLRRMKERARSWSSDFLRAQASLFQKSLPDYPELTETLEAELHRRNLNQLLRVMRREPAPDLKALLQKYQDIPDYAEMIRTEMEIRSGKTRLSDPAGGKEARIV